MAKRILLKTKRITVDELAMMTVRGFEDLEERLTARMDKGFELVHQKMDKGFAEMRELFQAVRKDIIEVENLRQRVHALEVHTGLIRSA